MADSRLYKVLGISKNATRYEIRKAFKRKGKEYEVRNGSEEAKEKRQELVFAYEILSDPEKRALYDKYGLQGVMENDEPELIESPSPFFSFPNFLNGADDILGMGFGGMGMRMGRQKKKDSALEMKVTLEDLYNGSKFKIPISREVICSQCTGMGGNVHGIRPCSACQGRGQVWSSIYLAPGFSQKRLATCGSCKGQGTVLLDKYKCRQCQGQKILQQSETLEVNVNKGMKDRQKLRFPCKGDEGVNMEPGDFYIVLKQTPHGTFERAADDLVLKVNVSLADALCGFEKVIRQLDGRDLHAKLEPGEILKPDCVKRIESEGMPMFRTPYLRGDLILKFQIDFPENHFCDEYSLKVLEKLLPPRPETTVPNLNEENVEEVTMFDLSPHDEAGRPRVEAYGSDEEDSSGPSHLRCAHQ